MDRKKGKRNKTVTCKESGESEEREGTRRAVRDDRNGRWTESRVAIPDQDATAGVEAAYQPLFRRQRAR